MSGGAHSGAQSGRACCRMERTASVEGAQVALAFFRQRSFSDERMVTVTVRVSGCSTWAVL